MTLSAGGGAILILAAYFLVSTKRLSPDSKKFQWLNLFGAIGIVVNSVHFRAYPSAGLNVVWAIIAVYGLAKAFKSSARD